MLELFNSLIKIHIKVFKVLVCRIRSLYYSGYIDQGYGKIIISDPWLSIKISKSKGARIINNGDFRILPHLGGTTPVRIILGQNSTLHIDGDFIIGHGVRFFINENAILYFGGKRVESDSGITSDSLIMVNRKIHIGYDFICAWNVFISDSDWHQIGNQRHQADIEIGDHVWIANNCSILKGSIIGTGTVVASHTKVINKQYPAKALIAGIPARIIKNDINWSRDIKEI